MTTYVVVAIRDLQLNAYANPWYTPTPGAAIRAFTDETNNPQSPMHKHPEDYELVQLGTWDDNTGRFTNSEVPKQLAHAKNLKIDT